MNVNASVSGVKNAFLRQYVSANNVANINTKGYQAKNVVNHEAKNGGVRGAVENTKAQANAKNNNVSLTNEMVNQINNANQEKANVNVLKSQNEMIGSLIDLKA